ncbi:ABC-type uncharacterized transport system permease subunit [Kitasatospora sp. MAP12-15]|nr:hypothetical protein [Kitasatospora sp. MAP12-44]MDH6113702.1 ABC-type uncharacterized transport system permease subunit [Kitasatospora sp. MAP12-44]
MAAIAGPCAHVLARRWALQSGFRPWEAAVIAWAAGAAASAVVLRL